jgi:hypothetical protein
VTSCEKKQEILLTAAKALAKNCGIPYDPEKEDPQAFIHRILKSNANFECKKYKNCRREEK